MADAFSFPWIHFFLLDTILHLNTDHSMLWFPDLNYWMNEHFCKPAWLKYSQRKGHLSSRSSWTRNPGSPCGRGFQVQGFGQLDASPCILKALWPFQEVWAPPSREASIAPRWVGPPCSVSLGSWRSAGFLELPRLFANGSGNAHISVTPL